VTLPFVDERLFLTVTQLVLPIHVVADPVPTEDPAAYRAPIADPAPVEDAATALTETSC
jgi:hypothetical protein